MWDEEPNNLDKFLTTEEDYTQEKIAVQEVNYSNDYVLVSDKECLANNFQ